MFVWKFLLVVVPVLLLGCASGLNRSALQERLNDGSLQSPDVAITDVRNLKPQLQFPCRIAIYLKPGESDWHWSLEDRAAMQQWAAELKREGIATDLFPLPELAVNKSSEGKMDLKALRLAAARCGADALFVIHGVAQTDSYKNFATVFDITVLGGFFIPSSHRDSLFMAEGVLFDVDNGFIYTAVLAEGEGKIIRPTFLVENKDAVEKAKTKAIKQFGDELLNRMRVLAATPPSPHVINHGNIQTDDPKPKPTSSLGSLPVGPVSSGGVVNGIMANGIMIPKPTP